MEPSSKDKRPSEQQKKDYVKFPQLQNYKGSSTTGLSKFVKEKQTPTN